VRLIIDNVLTADWVPGQPFTFSYSTLQPRDEPPGYQALNDLYVARLDSRTGEILRADPVVQPRPAGVYGLWGTQFAWSPDGTRLAWAQADRMGMVDSEAGALRPYLEYSVYTTTLSNGWLWSPSLAWSPDGSLLTMSLHGAPLGDETPETSPAFDIAALQPDGRFLVNPVIAQAGMWSAPRYSPLRTGSDGAADGLIAYLQARNPINSVSSDYDLVVADRDGSNRRILFPGPDQPGIRPLDDDSDLAWSPDGSAIAVVYQGDLYVVDVQTGNATQVTLVGNARHPRWVR
jgi:Tol biopolymer transport system component